MKCNLCHVGLVKCRASCHPVLLGQTPYFLWDTYQTLILPAYKNSHESTIQLIYLWAGQLCITYSVVHCHERIVARTQMACSGLPFISTFTKIVWLLLNMIHRGSMDLCPLTMLDLMIMKPKKPTLPIILSPVPQMQTNSQFPNSILYEMKASQHFALQRTAKSSL